ncbi:30S ribosomal protein S3 [Candidatus Falkowbacteria bacterium]|jgi:small subunit ribosomal protein S3|nr:30S ribosomal protein S3 [Patescibacteria group bacterium]MDD3434913.1 30S ribosomal protein S3 [Patescibacteria group bacterium]MDD4466449.1 30S ribosomal protein S3 [Patescibacteria group bacterium]NCU43005.1 30S ribosomal protein S3 [Candidatus Falkowbacteria bacterium]
MGKKVNPKIMRLGITKSWDSVWFESGQNYIKNVAQDIQVRRYIIKNFREAGIEKVQITRNLSNIRVDVWTGKPGLIIGRGGNGVEELKKTIHRRFLKNFRPNDIILNIKESARPGVSAQIAVQSVIIDLEKRMAFRRVMKQTLSRIERAGALGAKIVISGRLNGAEIARTEKLVWGKVPLNTLRADIDYARGAASTTYGQIGVKVWVYKGEVFDKDSEEIFLENR